MNDYQVHADFETLTRQVSEIKACSRNMEMEFDKFIASMQEIGDDTEILFGVSADSLISQFDSLKNRFSNYTERVDKLAELVSKTGESTERTDKDISNMVEELGD